ncbi:MAG: endonuclease [Bacteroidia bacterium]|nr:endonuclease [Bacteroidia bacterium]
MKKAFITSVLLAIQTLTIAQIAVSKSELTFPETEYNTTSKQVLTIENKSNESVTVSLSSLNEDFTLSNTSIVIAENSSEEVELTFKPRHNISYNTEVVVNSNSAFGSLSVNVLGTGTYDAYYAGTQNLYEEDLKAALKSAISKGYVNLGYNGARDRMYGSIDNKGGKVTCVYTGRSASFNTRSGANSNSFNCEHTWPQSLFNKNEPERADIHHLFPTDVDANSRRSNYRFGVVSSSTWSSGGSKLGGGVFEPRDVHKGDVARAMLYFATRYQNYSSFLSAQESILRKWSEEYPPNQASKDRNEAIFGVQKNRNPFVDYPEFLERITSISSQSKAPDVYKVTPSAGEVDLSVSSTNSFTYMLVLSNVGNKEVNFTSITNSSSGMKVQESSVSIAPGESKTVELFFLDGSVSLKDTVRLNSSNVNLSIPVTLNKVASVSPMETKAPILWVSNRKLTVSQSNNYTLNVFNQMGQLVYFTEIQSEFAEINLQGLNSGVYFVQRMGENKQRVTIHKLLLP